MLPQRLGALCEGKTWVPCLLECFLVCSQLDRVPNSCCHEWLPVAASIKAVLLVGSVLAGLGLGLRLGLRSRLWLGLGSETDLDVDEAMGAALKPMGTRVALLTCM